jgi:acyl-CoA thioesterase FadM
VNLLCRLLWLFLSWRSRSACDALGPCSTPFRVLPSDLDLLRHVNNGVYFSLLDLGRMDLMLRSGAYALFRARGWYPVVAAETMRFRRSLRLLQRFTIETSVVGWDEQAFLIEQKFVRGAEVVAEAIVRARLLKRAGGTVSTEEALQLLAKATSSPPLVPWLSLWNEQNTTRPPGANAAR